MSWLWCDQNPSPHLIEMARDRYPTFCDRFGGIVSPVLKPFLEQVASGVLPRFSNANTLYHGDFSPKNICFKVDGTLVAFDWQLAGHGNPAFDLVRFLAASLSDPEPECRMDSLFECYHQALIGAGVSDYPLDVLRRDVRAAVALRLARPIAIGGDPDEIDVVRARTVRRELGDWAALLTHASVEEVYA
jgi:aminoglycoside phosphotransferase (APT) family kinase protein